MPRDFFSDLFAGTITVAPWRANKAVAVRIGIVAGWLVVLGLVVLRALYLG